MAEKEVSHTLQEPFEILNKYTRQLKRLRSGKHGEQTEPKHLGTGKTSSEMGHNTSDSQKLSAVSIMRMAEMVLSQFTPQKAFGFDSGLVRRHQKHLNRVLWLIEAAEKFSNQQYDQAEELLILALSGSHAEHPIERVITWFARDLRERTHVITGKIDLEKELLCVDIDQGLMELKADIHAFEQKLPFTQISHFTVTQTILDTVASAKRIHIIDIGKKVGSYLIVIMHALANRETCKVEQLKITVVCLPSDNVEETGKLLSSFAESMNLPFVFKILHSNLYELKKDQFELEADYKVAVCLEFCLIVLSSCPKNVEGLLKAVESINPHVMVVNDMEVSSSGSTFTDRFKEALFLCSAMFDSLEACLLDCQFRGIIEMLYFQKIISNRVLSEDDGSFTKCLKIDFWREYFGRFGIVETELSQLSMYQASLMVRKYPWWKDCTLSMNGEAMLIGWTGFPFRSVSAWKFQGCDNNY